MDKQTNNNGDYNIPPLKVIYIKSGFGLDMLTDHEAKNRNLT